MSGTWASSWATGDVVTAAEFRKGMGCVADSTLGVAAASFDFTGLPTSYAHLVIELYARGDTAANNTLGLLRFNNDSAANYLWQRSSVTATTFTGVEGLAQSNITVGLMPAASAAANFFGVTRIYVPNYANTANYKSCVIANFIAWATTTGTMASEANGGIWRVANAINRVTVLPTAGSFAAGSRCSIYVMGS